MPDEPNDDLAASRALAAKLAQGEWAVDDFTLDAEPEPEPIAEAPPAPPPPPPASLPSLRPPESAEPPSPEGILEAMLFVGGPPLTLESVAQVIRGFTPDRVRETLDALNRKYRAQNRPYLIQPKDDGYQLVVKPSFKNLRERLYGGPKEARLSQPALDVLSLIAYRQPISKGELDSLRGADSSAHLRQLVRLGIITVTQRGDADKASVGYGTTPRFLELFQLTTIEDLPKLGDTQLA
ncbi:MAG: SMC-Scp complex subunit ScpB [Fimbriiglobus sp.]